MGVFAVFVMGSYVATIECTVTRRRKYSADLALVDLKFPALYFSRQWLCNP